LGAGTNFKLIRPEMFSSTMTAVITKYLRPMPIGVATYTLDQARTLQVSQSPQIRGLTTLQVLGQPQIKVSAFPGLCS